MAMSSADPKMHSPESREGPLRLSSRRGRRETHDVKRETPCGLLLRDAIQRIDFGLRIISHSLNNWPFAERNINSSRPAVTSVRRCQTRQKVELSAELTCATTAGTRDVTEGGTAPASTRPCVDMKRTAAN